MMNKINAWILVFALVFVSGQSKETVASTPDIDIWKAAASGNLEAIKQHLEAGTDVDAKDSPGGSTPLLVAATFGQVEATKLLIEKDANVNATSNDGATGLHGAAFFCHTEIVNLLLDEGAQVNAKNVRGETPLDAVAGQWSQELDGIYKWLAELWNLQLDLERIKATRPKIAALLRKAKAKTEGQRKEEVTEVKSTGYRGSYFMNGQIHVNTYGTPEGKPLTSGYQDFKPSWSKTGDMLVFFRRLKDDPVVTNWKTQIHIINVDGTGLHAITDGTHTDFNQTWTRDGTNTPIWNRKNPVTDGFIVMKSKVGAKPSQEVALTDKSYHTWAYSCLTDGRILVQCTHPKQGWGYYLMTPNDRLKPKFERIGCELAKKGLLDRISISPSEKKICFEYQKGFQYKDTGRTLYLADFNAKKLSITNAIPLANREGTNRWFAYPRWTNDEAAIVYHASPSLYLYTLKDGSTVKVSTKDGADYRYPHCEATPK
ncbi:MAG: ankyrin repeat domain-containing protein [Phycisphaerae bacterium]|nr:ankyrin repeat domain-containing protein [Phycisphaerae bacterium]